MTSILFDFGGTIDTNGVHWSEKFNDAFKELNLIISASDFSKSYGFAVKEMDKFINKEFNLYQTLFKQINLQLKFLAEELNYNFDVEKISQSATEICYNDVKKTVKDVIPFFEKIKNKFRIGLVSNYHGNLISVLTELEILNYFEVIIDSSIVNIWKPDPKIFSYAINEMKVLPEETFVIGDSYERDIVPAKKIGCKTIWLKGRSWKEEPETSKADWIISNLTDASKILFNEN